MSSYFLGGFSAYWIEPSGRRLNHSGCCGDPRMIGRALHREVQGHLHPVVGAGGDEAAEIGERAELRMDGVVAAVRRADGVEAAGIAGVGGERVVAALAVGAADRMDRGEIDHIEAERCDLGQARDAVVEGAVAARNAALAARHHLVPGAGAGERPIGHQRHGGAAGEVGLLVGGGGGRNLVQRAAGRASVVSASRHSSRIRRASAALRGLRSSRICRPSNVSRLTSSPAWRLARMSRRQVAKTSVQASIAYS